MPRRAAPAIRPLPFRHNRKPGLGFEIFRLSELVARADGRALDHALDAPQRPEFHTVYVGIEGRGHLVVDFAPVPVGAGTLTFVARGRVQQLGGARGVDAWMLLFAPEFVEAQPGSPDPLVMPSVLGAMWGAPWLAVPAAEHAELLTIARLLDAEHARPLDGVQPWLLAALLRALLLRAVRLAGPRVAAPAQLGTFFTILERDHARTRSVAHYARAAGLSTRRLHELVTATTGKSTKQVIDERVVIAHKRLLAHTGISVKELAAATGFDEPTNLVKFFKHHTGDTPLAWRAAHAPPALR